MAQMPRKLHSVEPAIAATRAIARTGRSARSTSAPQIRCARRRPPRASPLDGMLAAPRAPAGYGRWRFQVASAGEPEGERGTTVRKR